MMNMNWEKVVERLPGVLLKDQQPEGSGIAVSIERAENQWRVHYAKETDGGFKIRHSAPVSAQDVYEKLAKLFRNAGFVPQLDGKERALLGLPSLEAIQSDRLIQKMPGLYLGLQDDIEDSMGWGFHYSVQKNGSGDYTLYSCLASDVGESLSEPEIEALGTYSQAELWEETLYLGLSLEHYPFFTEIAADSWEDAAKAMPGRLLQSDRRVMKKNLVSAAEGRNGRWNLFYAVPERRGGYFLKGAIGLAAKEFYMMSFERLNSILTKTDAEALHLPPLTEIYGEALQKKLKGRFLGGIAGADGSGRPCEIFLSLTREKNGTWTFHIADAHNLLNGSRKILVQKIGPFHPVERDKMMEALLERNVDLLELLSVLEESDFPETLDLADELREYLEK